MKYAFLLLFVLSTTLCFSLRSLDVETGLVFHLSSESQSAPNPAIFQGFGVSMPFLEEEGFFIDAGILLYGGHYEYVNGRATPADMERADTIWTLMVQLDGRIGYTFRINDTLTFTSAFGPTVIGGIPIFAFDSGEAVRGDLFLFFYTNIRFLHFQGQLSLQWRLAEKFSLVFKVRGLYPVSAILEFLDYVPINGMKIQGIVAAEIDF
ncbi:MAG: hypothetical protein JW904_00435 [Spirochaetales bacterium]|nr:hypothetical protein [Spirochaetales bacterium]